MEQAVACGMPSGFDVAPEASYSMRKEVFKNRIFARLAIFP